jgi:hypothetical protein
MTRFELTQGVKQLASTTAALFLGSKKVVLRIEIEAHEVT